MALQSDIIAGASFNELFLLREELPDLWQLVAPAITAADYPVPELVPVPGCLFPLIVPQDLEAETWGQSIDAIAAIESMEQDELTGRLRLLAIYFQPVFNNGVYDSDQVEETEYLIRHMKATHALGVSSFFAGDIARIAKTLNDAIQTVPYTQEEEKAGVRELEAFGIFATLDSITKGNSLQIDKWMRQPWAFVNAKLLLENKRAFIQHRLNKLLTPKQQAA